MLQLIYSGHIPRGIKAIYNFIVGDMINLNGVIITILIFALINIVSALAPLSAPTGAILVLAVLGVLTTTLFREVNAKRK